MAGRKRSQQPASSSAADGETEEDYREKRSRNNDAVNKTRQKKRQEETETAKRVEELRSENTELERKVESLQKELAFLKEMFVAYAAGNKKKGGEAGDKPGSAEKPGTIVDDEPHPDAARFASAVANAAKTSAEALEGVAKFSAALAAAGNDRDGISLLEVKNHDLLCYLSEMALLMNRMSCGDSIHGDPAVERSVKHRTVLERIRPIEQKMKGQIEKITQTSSSSKSKAVLRARPDQMELDGAGGGGDDDEEEEEEGGEKWERAQKYVPPKIMAVRYDEDEVSREERDQSRRRRRALQSSLIQELKQQYSEAPEEVHEESGRSLKTRQQDKERQQYEEDYFMRVQLSKKERATRKKEKRANALDNLLQFGDYMAGDEKDAERKRKGGKSTGGPKGKKFKSSKGGKPKKSGSWKKK